jgi:hypothetical protein
MSSQEEAMRRLRRVAVLTALVTGALFAAAPAAAAAAGVTLAVSPTVAPYGSTVALTGAVDPAAATPVEVYRWNGAAWKLVAAGTSHAGGAFALSAVARAPGELVARTADAESAPVLLRVRPRLEASWQGLRILGAPLAVKGTLRPRVAGDLRVTVRGRTRTIPVRAGGRFTAQVPTGRHGRLEAKLELAPAPGYARARRSLATTIRAPVLGVGSKGDAVRFLEGRLRELRYAFLGRDSTFTTTTRDALYAFQKVQRLRVDGRTGTAVWKALHRARVPRAAVPRGSHIEVDKTRQVLMEVRRGKVVKVVHVSTGATGNTPVGRWDVYLRTPGLLPSGMYYSLFFLRGFAIHGYASVPTWPASHGCVRVPMWFAPRIYARWPVGATVRVLP